MIIDFTGTMLMQCSQFICPELVQASSMSGAWGTILRSKSNTAKKLTVKGTVTISFEANGAAKKNTPRITPQILLKKPEKNLDASLTCHTQPRGPGSLLLGLDINIVKY